MATPTLAVNKVLFRELLKRKQVQIDLDKNGEKCPDGQSVITIPADYNELKQLNGIITNVIKSVEGNQKSKRFKKQSDNEIPLKNMKKLIQNNLQQLPKKFQNEEYLESSKSVFVAGLKDTTISDVEKIFLKISCQIHHIEFLTNKKKKSLGCAVVFLKNKKQVKHAITSLNQIIINDNVITVRENMIDRKGCGFQNNNNNLNLEIEIETVNIKNTKFKTNANETIKQQSKSRSDIMKFSNNSNIFESSTIVFKPQEVKTSNHREETSHNNKRKSNQNKNDDNMNEVGDWFEGSSLTLLGHCIQEGRLFYEVCWSHPGRTMDLADMADDDDDESFWFDREELMEYHATALLAYEAKNHLIQLEVEEQVEEEVDGFNGGVRDNALAQALDKDVFIPVATIITNPTLTLNHSLPSNEPQVTQGNQFKTPSPSQPSLRRLSPTTPNTATTAPKPSLTRGVAKWMSTLASGSPPLTTPVTTPATETPAGTTPIATRPTTTIAATNPTGVVNNVPTAAPRLDATDNIEPLAAAPKKDATDNTEPLAAATRKDATDNIEPLAAAPKKDATNNTEPLAAVPRKNVGEVDDSTNDTIIAIGIDVPPPTMRILGHRKNGKGDMMFEVRWEAEGEEEEDFWFERDELMSLKQQRDALEAYELEHGL